MIKKFLSISIVALFYFSAAYAEESIPTISVLDFAVSNISDEESLVLTDYLSSVIHQSGLYRVIDRSQRETILKELQFSLSGCADESCQLEAGRLLQARYIIVGSVGSLGSRFFLNMKLIDVETGETLNTSSNKYNSVDLMIDDSEALALNLLSLGDEAAATMPEPEKKNEDDVRRAVH